MTILPLIQFVITMIAIFIAIIALYKNLLIRSLAILQSGEVRRARKRLYELLNEPPMDLLEEDEAAIRLVVATFDEVSLVLNFTFLRNTLEKPIHINYSKPLIEVLHFTRNHGLLDKWRLDHSQELFRHFESMAKRCEERANGWMVSRNQ